MLEGVDARAVVLLLIGSDEDTGLVPASAGASRFSWVVSDGETAAAKPQVRRATNGDESLIGLRRMPPKPRLLIAPVGEYAGGPCRSDMTEAAGDREHPVFLIADLDDGTDRRCRREGETSQPHLLHEDPIGSVGSGFAPHNPGPSHSRNPTWERSPPQWGHVANSRGPESDMA